MSGVVTRRRKRFDLDDALGSVPSGGLEELTALARLQGRLFSRSSSPELSRYRLRDVVGRGGGGVVCRAYDPKLDREVAIKLVRVRGGRVGDTDMQARLRREAQALAQLSHENVVQIFDVGTYSMDGAEHPLDVPDEGVFVAMELVDGVDLETWLRAGPRRSTTEILQVFAAAGRGLAAAHRRGLVHRDFKPANVLVGTDGRVRVADFGLARARGDVSGVTEPDRGTVSGELTATGVVMGTPAYMAPEQHAGQPADARADQYAFCVSVFEALCQHRPFAGSSTRALWIAKRGGPPPIPPSVPRRLRAVLKRGLQPDPARRAPSMDPVLGALGPAAVRPGRWLAVGALSVAGGVAWLGVGEDERGPCSPAIDAAVAAVWAPVRAEAVRAQFTATGVAYAEDTWRRVDHALSGHLEHWHATYAEVCASADGRVADDARFSCLRRDLDEVRALVDVWSAADQAAVGRAVAAAHSLPDVADCAVARRSQTDALPGAVDVRAQLARAHALQRSGAYRRGLAVAQAEVELAEGLGDPGLLAEALYRTGVLQSLLGQFEAAEHSLVSAQFHASQAGNLEVAASAATRLVYAVGVDLRRSEEALSWSRHAQAALDRLGNPPLAQSNLFNNLGALHNSTNEFDAALSYHQRTSEIRREMYEGDDAKLAVSLNNLGNTYGYLGRHDEAHEHLRRALGMYERLYGPEHPDVAMALNNLGQALEALERPADAAIRYRQALRVWETALGPEHPDVARVATNLAELLTPTEPEQAVALARRALAIRSARLGPEHGVTGYTWLAAGRAQLAAGDREAARAAGRHAHQIGRRTGASWAAEAQALMDRAGCRLASDDAVSTFMCD